MAVEMLSTWRVTVRKLRGDARGANHTQGEPKTGSVVSCWISHPLEDVGHRAALPAMNRCGPMGLPGPLQEACGNSRHRTLHNINHTSKASLSLDTCVFRLTRRDLKCGVSRLCYTYLRTYLYLLTCTRAL